jgi:hypothetical protein
MAGHIETKWGEIILNDSLENLKTRANLGLNVKLQ